MNLRPCRRNQTRSLLRVPARIGPQYWANDQIMSKSP
jgi:hypothetical protein